MNALGHSPGIKAIKALSGYEVPMDFTGHSAGIPWVGHTANLGLSRITQISRVLRGFSPVVLFVDFNYTPKYYTLKYNI